tara:strand:+ start:41600 stop:44635 length:3036 start_codon:yes stop_codon:yes gene_type:complete
MAQYIKAPDFSYDPLPMQEYAQFAKEQALAYEGSLNSAYQFLDKLPILDGGLRTEGFAQELRQEYGSEVQKAIDNFVATKDRRALAREISAISTRLKTDNDVLVNNYDARAAAPTMQLFQSQPNGSNSFTKDGTMTPVLRVEDPETGEVIEQNNFRQFEMGKTTLQDAERSYNDYVGAYDVIDDTKFMTTNLFNDIQTAIGSKVTQDPNQPGVFMVQTDKGVKKFNNTLELVQDQDAMGEYYQASQDAIKQLQVQWDQNQSNTVRAYKYRGLDFQDYVNDAFATTMPKLHAYSQSTDITTGNVPEGGNPISAEVEKLAEVLIGKGTNTFLTEELDKNEYFTTADKEQLTKLAERVRSNGYTLKDLLNGTFPESEEFIKLSQRLATKQAMDARLNDPVNQGAMLEENIEFDASGSTQDGVSSALANYAQRNPGVNGDNVEELFKFYSSIGVNLGMYGQSELFGMELEDYDFTTIDRWIDDFADPFVDSNRFDRKASPVAVQTDVLKEGLKEFGPGLGGTIPMMTPEAYDVMLAAKANGIEDITGLSEYIRQEQQNIINPAIGFFADEKAPLIRENLTYDQAVERGLVPETVQTIFNSTDGDAIRYSADFANPETLLNFIEARNNANSVKSDIIKESNRYEVYTPTTTLHPSGETKITVDDKLAGTLITDITTNTDIGKDYQIYVLNKDNSTIYGPESLGGSGYNYMTDITAEAEGGALANIFFGKGTDKEEARYNIDGVAAGVGAGQKSGVLLDVNLRDTDQVDDALKSYFSAEKSSRLLIVPKSTKAKEYAFSWIDDYRSKLTTSYAPSYSATGLFGTGPQSGDQMRQLVELGNKLNVFNYLFPLNSQAAMKSEGVPITNTYVKPQMGFAVVFDPYRPVGNNTPGRQGVQLSEVYAAKHEDGDGAAWTWQEYFSNRTDDSPIMVEEALLAAHSQQLSEDFSPEELTELSKLINEKTSRNQEGYGFITLGDFKDLFQKAGLDYNFNKGMLFHNKFDLTTFTSMLDPQAVLSE